jgi:hypothetical protein
MQSQIEVEGGGWLAAAPQQVWGFHRRFFLLADFLDDDC